MKNIKFTKKIKLSPYSEYYAIVPQDQKAVRNPILVVEDRKVENPTILLERSADTRGNFYQKDISALIVKDVNDLTFEDCTELLDVPCARIVVVKVPLVAESRGGVRKLPIAVDFK